MRKRHKRRTRVLNVFEIFGTEIKCSSNHGLESTAAPLRGFAETHP